MPLKLNVGASRKVTDNNYGSRGASVNLELEFDTGLASEPDKLHERIRHLFGLVRASLTEELNGGANQPCLPAGSTAGSAIPPAVRVPYWVGSPLPSPRGRWPAHFRLPDARQ